MDYYFGKPTDNIILLDDDESNHLINVKRIRTGEIVHVTDGEGNNYITEFFSIEKKKCSLKILEKNKINKNSFHLHIALAPTKNIERMEWFLEKAIETGIDEISFLKCRHSERKEIKIERLNRIAVSAMKQSLKSFLPKINPMVDFNKFVSGKLEDIKLICIMPAGENNRLNKIYLPGKNLIALIGPEGDFHADEVKFAMQSGFKPTSLGTSRLRTETAALNVCTLFNFINNK